MARMLRALALGLALLVAPAARAAELTVPPAGLTVHEAWEAPAPEGFVVLQGAAFEAQGPAAEVALLEELQAHGKKSLPALAKQLGVPIGGTIRVVLAPDQESFRTLQPGSPPTWADATAYPSRGLVYLRHPKIRGGQARPLTQVLDHELVHILLGRAFAPADPPRWLQEGTAQVLAGEAGPETTAALARGLMGGRPIPLEDLERGFPADAHRADLAYAESADFVGWFRVTYGADALARLVKLVREGDTLASAVRRITGVPLTAVDAVWSQRLQGFLPALSMPGNLDTALLGVGAVGLVAVGWSRRRTRTQRLGGWKSEDAALTRLAREVVAWRARRRGSVSIDPPAA